MCWWDHSGTIVILPAVYREGEAFGERGDWFPLLSGHRWQWRGRGGGRGEHGGWRVVFHRVWRGGGGVRRRSRKKDQSQFRCFIFIFVDTECNRNRIIKQEVCVRYLSLFNWAWSLRLKPWVITNEVDWVWNQKQTGKRVDISIWILIYNISSHNTNPDMYVIGRFWLANRWIRQAQEDRASHLNINSCEWAQPQPQDT